MRDIDVINELMIDLREAVASKQWLKLQDVDRRIAEKLVILNQRQPLADEMRGVLNKLQYLYVKAFEHCEKESELLANKMAEFRRNRDGMAAYSSLDDID